jgi:thiosulfate reductase cytochrome b subunit
MLFVVIHLVEMVLAGVFNQIRSMIFGTYEISLEKPEATE